jgi:putative endonuclease
MSLVKGTKGEQVAEKYLLSLGYQILTTNYHSYFGEIDIVCNHKDTVVFVEVKNFKPSSLVSPYQSVRKGKQNKIIKTAKKYLMENSLHDTAVRFDLVVVESGKILDHLKGAFSL